MRCSNKVVIVLHKFVDKSTKCYCLWSKHGIGIVEVPGLFVRLWCTRVAVGVVA